MFQGGWGIDGERKRGMQSVGGVGFENGGDVGVGGLDVSGILVSGDVNGGVPGL